MRRGIIVGRALFCPVCQIFNHAAKYTHHIERSLKTTPRLRLKLGQWLFIPANQTALVTTAAILRVLQTHPAQNIRPLLNHLQFQHNHLYTTQHPDRDLDRDNPHSPFTHALYTKLSAPLTSPCIITLLPTRSPTTAKCAIAIAALSPCARARLPLFLHQVPAYV